MGLLPDVRPGEAVIWPGTPVGKPDGKSSETKEGLLGTPEGKPDEKASEVRAGFPGCVSMAPGITQVESTTVGRLSGPIMV